MHTILKQETIKANTKTRNIYLIFALSPQKRKGAHSEPQGLDLTVGFIASGAEEIAAAAPEAKFVKCFNQTGFANMVEPRGSMMFVCGDEVVANEVVRELAADIGFDAITIGDLSKARLLEPLAMLWIHLSSTTDLKRDFAFRIDRH